MDPVASLANNLASGVRLTDSSPLDNPPTSTTSGQGSTFKWKVDAPEFVPRFSSPTAVSNNATVSASHWATSALQRDLPVTDAAAQPYFNDGLSQNAPGATADSSSVLCENVNWIVGELQNNPENFDRLTVQFLNFLQREIQPPLDAGGAGVVFSRLIDAALVVPNFAYLCVRLMANLHDGFSIGDQAPQGGQPGELWFRDALLDSLQKEFNNQKTVLEVEEISADETQRLFLFLNVLCMFATLLSLHGRPYKPLSWAIYHVLEGVVKRRSDAFVRVAIQTLKTVGAHLESTEKIFGDKRSGDADRMSTPLMDKLIDLLECIGTENSNANTLSENTRFMIRNLRGVRRHWAYVAPPPPSPVVAESSPNNAYYDDASIPPIDNCCPADYLNASASSLPLPYNDDGVAYEDPYGPGAVYFGYLNSTGLGPPPNGGFDYSLSPDFIAAAAAGGNSNVFLTSAEAAFLEAAAADIDEDALLASTMGGGGALVGGPPQAATVPTSASLSSDDDAIADAYEDFLRNMQQQQTPPQRQFGR